MRIESSTKNIAKTCAASERRPEESGRGRLRVCTTFSGGNMKTR